MESETTEPEGLADPQDKLILLVDDDESVLDSVEHVLKKQGFRTARAVRGDQALQTARTLHPDLIVLDFMLPAVSGFEILRSLQEGETYSIPIIAVSGRPMDYRNIGMIKNESNVREFFPKPVKLNILTMTVHQILHTRPTLIREESAAKRAW